MVSDDVARRVAFIGASRGATEAEVAELLDVPVADIRARFGFEFDLGALARRMRLGDQRAMDAWISDATPPCDGWHGVA